MLIFFIDKNKHKRTAIAKATRQVGIFKNEDFFPY